ncbi:hypothetical protein OPV22_027465 [Ensete ventricosum]|uniref:Uncharacterized protein n=1 Tax=Ensete ventricosum TaxID=4639 RepID=A0AAV8Q5G3_ENSVE|nr:hypothetical protein OPV22_027465 [Ensete ventricosum]
MHLIRHLIGKQHLRDTLFYAENSMVLQRSLWFQLLRQKSMDAVATGRPPDGERTWIRDRGCAKACLVEEITDLMQPVKNIGVRLRRYSGSISRLTATTEAFAGDRKEAIWHLLVVLVVIDCTLGETSKASEMEEILMQREVTAVDKAGNVVLDIEGLTQSSDKCSGSPKMTKALSRKGSCRMERRNSEEQDVDDTAKRVVVKVVLSHMEQFKQPLIMNKALVIAPTSTNTPLSDAGDGKPRKFIRVTTINPRRILLLFASLSSMGTMILIYFTLALHQRQSLD